jgi:hypothetical protein
MDTFTKKLALPPGQGGSVADLQAQFAQVQQENDRTLRELTSTLATLKDRNRQGEIWQKDPATASYLQRKIDAINARGDELRRAWDKRGDLKIAAAATGPAIQVNGANFKVTTDTSALPAGSEDGVISTVQNITAQETARRSNAAGGRFTQYTFDPQFVSLLQNNPDAAKITALAANEVNRIDSTLTHVAPSSLKLGAGGFDPKAVAHASPSPMTDLQVGQVVDQIIQANPNAQTWTGPQREFLKNQITKLLLFRSK